MKRMKVLGLIWKHIKVRGFILWFGLKIRPYKSALSQTSNTVSSFMYWQMLWCWLVQIGVHYGGIFYEFVPWNGVVSWEIAPWGKWYIVAENQTHKVIVHLLIDISISSPLCASFKSQYLLPPVKSMILVMLFMWKCEAQHPCGRYCKLVLNIVDMNILSLVCRVIWRIKWSYWDRIQ